MKDARVAERGERQGTAGRGEGLSQRATVELLAAALDAALAELADEAFVIGPDGAVLHANPAGRARMAGEGESLTARLADNQQRFRRRALPNVSGATAPLGYLIFVPRTTVDMITAAAARRWSLTRRQSQVLARMTAGDFNKEIAFALACSRRAVEHHITAILRKTGTHSRAELLTRVFTIQGCG